MSNIIGKLLAAASAPPSVATIKDKAAPQQIEGIKVKTQLSPLREALLRTMAPKKMVECKYKGGGLVCVGDVVEDHGKAMFQVSSLNECTITLTNPVLGKIEVEPKYFDHCTLLKKK
jgi:hypothetical protein